GLRCAQSDNRHGVPVVVLHRHRREDSPHRNGASHDGRGRVPLEQVGGTQGQETIGTHVDLLFSYVLIVSATIFSTLNSRTPGSRPAFPIVARRPGSRRSATMACARAASSCGGTSSPVSLSATASGSPPARVATTARGHAIASEAAEPGPS